MRKLALLAAPSAGALFTILVSVSNKVDAMTFSNTSSALDVLATADNTAKAEHARGCRVRDCRSRYYYEPPAYYWGWYRAWPYYPYYNFGTGQSNFGFAR
jgi:hypothetical protein